MKRPLSIALILTSIALPVWLHYDSSAAEHLLWFRTPKSHCATTLLITHHRVAFYFDFDLPPPPLFVKYQRTPLMILSGNYLHRWVGPGPAAAATPVILFSLPGALLLANVAHRQWKRLRQHPPGHCRECGYDLRATPDRCPECGTSVSTAAV